MHKGHNIYFDNFYTTLPLCKQLYHLGFSCCGTVRSNRKGIPQDFQQKKLKRGETCFNDGEVLGLKWMDKRPVAMLSTIHDGSSVAKMRRNKAAPGGTETVMNPKMIEYNTYMGGVDKADQLVTYYAFSHCSKKWWNSWPLIYETNDTFGLPCHTS